MSSPNQDAKAEARRVFEETGNISKASNASGIRRATIRAWIKREVWIVHMDAEGVQPTQAASDNIRARVIDFTTRKAIEQVEASGAVAAHVDYVAASLEAHGRAASDLLTYAQELLAQARAGEVYIPKMQSHADFGNALASMVQRAIAISRDVAGLKAGQASAAQGAESEGPIIIEQRRLEPRFIDVDEKGRKIDVDAA